MKRLRILAALTGVLLCASGVFLWANTTNTNQVMYTVQKIVLPGTTPEYSVISALNNQGQAAGWADMDPSDNLRHPYLYSGGTFTDLGTFGGGSGGGPNGVNGLNNLGQAAGYAEYAGAAGEPHAFLYTGGGLIDLAPNNTTSSANGINDSGQVVGEVLCSDNYTRGFVYSGGTLTVLGATDTTRSTQALGIDASGEIFGIANNRTGNSGSYGWFYSNGTFTNMFSPCVNNCSSVNAMNNLGQVVGGLGFGSRYPFLYNGRTGVMTDLSQGSAFPDNGGTATAINDNGQAVGWVNGNVGVEEVGFVYSGGTITNLYAWAPASNGDYRNEPDTINILGQVGGRAIVGGSNDSFHAYVYSNGVMTDLNTLIDSTLGITLGNVSRINDLGQIAASDYNYAYLLTPVLNVTSTHSGSFSPGQQSATYTLTVTNSPSAEQSTSGTISVTETLPAALTLVSMNGQGWTCASNTCTRTDSIGVGASYPAITVAVNVAGGATSPQVNRASVSEAGVQLGNAIDSTVIQALGSSTVTASNATAPFSTNSRNVTLAATVSAGGGPVNGGTVQFNVSGIGTATSGTVTNGNASASLLVAGNIHAGSYPINAVYSGTTGIAGSSDATKSLVITNAVPVITWANPPDMIAGSALGSGQLDATANVPGTFVYTPPAGTVLPQGSNTLSVVFTPNDSTDYSSTSATAIVNVDPGPGSTSGHPQFVVTRTLSRNASNNIVVVATVTNTGSQPAMALSAPYVTLNSCKLGSFTPISGPSVPGSIAPGASAQSTMTFPGSAGASGATVPLTINGSWFLDIGSGQAYGSDGGSFGSTLRTLLP
jgi:probable HAF family extracellular repeat protein